MCADTYMCADTHMRADIYMRANTYTRTNIYMRANTYTRANTHIRAVAVRDQRFHQRQTHGNRSHAPLSRRPLGLPRHSRDPGEEEHACVCVCVYVCGGVIGWSASSRQLCVSSAGLIIIIILFIFLGGMNTPRRY